MLYEDSIDYPVFPFEKKYLNIDNSSVFKYGPSLAPIVTSANVLFPGTKPLIALDYCNANYGECTDYRCLGLKGTKSDSDVSRGNSSGGGKNWTNTNISEAGNTTIYYGGCYNSYVSYLENIWPEYYKHANTSTYSAIMDGPSGGGFSFTISGHQPCAAFFRPVYASANCNYIVEETATRFGHTSASKFNIVTDQCPGYVGGALVFSGENLDDCWKESTPKNVILGIKGLVSDSSGYSTYMYNSNSWAVSIREYPFDTKHFTPLGHNYYSFYDEKMFPLNGVYSALSFEGPFLCDALLTTYRYDDGNGNNVQTNTISYNSNGLAITGTAISMEAFIQPISDKECALIMEPSGSMPYETQYGDSYKRINYYVHNTKTQTKLVLHPKKYGYGENDYYPYGATLRRATTYNYDPIPIKNVKKIVKINNSFKHVTTIAFPGTLTNLPSTWKNCDSLQCIGGTLSAVEAIPNSWNHLNNLRWTENLFKNNTKLKTIPTTWNGLDSVEFANNMFQNCTNLTNIPASWEGFGKDVISGENPGYQQYHSLFQGCTKLTKLPNLDQSWYNVLRFPCGSLFAGCGDISQTYDGETSLSAVCKHLDKIIEDNNITHTDYHIFCNDACSAFEDYEATKIDYGSKYF